MKENLDPEKVRYPLGNFDPPQHITPAVIKKWIHEIERLPVQLSAAVKNLTKKQLNTPYRDEGWTVRQVIHHLGDSHLNAYIRVKLALTEEHPTIKPYDQKAWAMLPDYELFAVKDSLKLLELLHRRWVVLLKTLKPVQWDRTFYHPESGTIIILKKSLGLYAWHGRHHLAQIKALISRKGW
jgi:hypothetical protein